MSPAALRRLLLAAAVPVAACGGSQSSTDDCHPSPFDKCVPRADAWSFVQRAGAGGTAGAGGAPSAGAAGAPVAVPDGCPTPDASEQIGFLQRFGMNGDHIVGAPKQSADTCCYTTTSYCEGRPLIVAGRLRTSPLARGAAWL